MTTFKQFLVEDGATRTKPIDQQQALQFAEKYCQQYLQNRNYLYRGMFERKDFLYGNSADSSPRVAKEIPNYYNLIMSNLPSWQQIPRRDQSFICSTDVKSTRNYGDPFLALIPNDTNVAIFHARDIWKGFPNIQRDLDVDLDTMAFAIDRIHKHINTKYTPQQTEHDFNSLIDFLNQAAKHTDRIKSDQNQSTGTGIIHRTIIQILELVQQKGAMNTLQYLFDPTGSVETYTASNIANINQIREAWFSGPAVFVNTGSEEKHRDFVEQALS